MTVPLRVGIYARVSTTEQNPEAQLTVLREYALGRGFVIQGEYIDHISGDLPQRRGRRPRTRDIAFDRLMADALQRRFDCVLVWKYDRLARSLGTLIVALQQFNSLGIDFISYTQNIDTTTPMGRLFFHIIGSFAEFERSVIVSGSGPAWPMPGPRGRSSAARSAIPPPRPGSPNCARKD
jgi:DNA invertase Pin-like site-specific DNA recombinase